MASKPLAPGSVVRRNSSSAAMGVAACGSMPSTVSLTAAADCTAFLTVLEDTVAPVMVSTPVSSASLEAGWPTNWPRKASSVTLEPTP